MPILRLCRGKNAGQREQFITRTHRGQGRGHAVNYQEQRSAAFRDEPPAESYDGRKPHKKAPRRMAARDLIFARS